MNQPYDRDHSKDFVNLEDQMIEMEKEVLHSDKE
jgi:hypothetical protein